MKAGTIIAGYFVYAVCMLGVFGVLGYVAWHFITKFW